MQMILTDEQKRLYEDEGFIIFEDLFNEAETDELREHVDVLDRESEEALRNIGQSGISVAHQINFTAHLTQRDKYIEKFAAQPKMAEILTQLLGPDVRLYWDQSVYKRQEANRDFPWHQDNGYGPIEPKHYVTCWLALEDATIENGCVWVMPRTHKQGVVEHRRTPIGLQCYFGEDPGFPVELRKGSMVAFHSLLFHRSTPNLSNTVRKGYIMQYSVDGAYNPNTSDVYNNGALVAKDGQPHYVPWQG